MIRTVWWIVCAMLIVGCSTPTRSWPNQEREMVWTAMVAAANSPQYKSSDPRKQWIVAENDVDANAGQGHIRIHRVLTRSLHLPQQVKQRDRRTWLFDIHLLPTDPPTVTFDTLHSGFIYVHTVDEADRYFSLVDDMLHPPVQ